MASVRNSIRALLSEPRRQRRHRLTNVERGGERARCREPTQSWRGRPMPRSGPAGRVPRNQLRVDPRRDGDCLGATPRSNHRSHGQVARARPDHGDQSPDLKRLCSVDRAASRFCSFSSTPRTSSRRTCDVERSFSLCECNQCLSRSAHRVRVRLEYALELRAVRVSVERLQLLAVTRLTRG